MKRILILAMALAVALVGVSCAPKAVETAEAVGEASDSPFATNYEGALPVLSQVMVGTFRLETTEHAVTAEQAAELLPLWRAYRGMASSDSAAKVELDALLDQIVETMSADQIEAISAMQLTRQDLMAIMQEQGIQMGGGNRGNLSEEQVQEMQTRIAQRQAAGGGPGGPPGGGFGGGRPGGPQAPDPQALATLRAQRGGGAGAGTFMVQGPLFDALVELLKSK